MIENYENIIKVNSYLLSKKKELNCEIGMAIRNYRKENNISIKEFSDKTFMSYNHLSQIETGKNGITLSKFIVICNALNINSDTILKEFLYNSKLQNENLINELQKGKNISRNIFKYLVLK